jgi:hypothetical protein
MHDSFPTKCARCGNKLRSSIRSKFNQEIICFECKRKEERHPRYAEACEAEERACKRGDFKFPGIGKPEDL